LWAAVPTIPKGRTLQQRVPCPLFIYLNN